MSFEMRPSPFAFPTLLGFRFDSRTIHYIEPLLLAHSILTLRNLRLFPIPIEDFEGQLASHVVASLPFAKWGPNPTRFPRFGPAAVLLLDAFLDVRETFGELVDRSAERSFGVDVDVPREIHEREERVAEL